VIYLPSQPPSPERPPSINREIVGVLLAMACISGLLVHYTRDTWCDLPVLGSFCLPPLIAPRQEAKVAEDAADGDAPDGGGLSRPAAPMTAAPTPALVDSFGAPAMGIPTPAGFPTAFVTDPTGGAYPGPTSDASGGFPGGLSGGFPGGLAPAATPPPGAVAATATSSFTTVGDSPDYPATATALALSSGSGSATATPSPSPTAGGATPTSDSGYPGPTNSGTPTSADL